MSERTARRVLVAAGEAAGARRAGRTGAIELFDSIRDAMFGEVATPTRSGGGGAARRRSTRRRAR